LWADRQLAEALKAYEEGLKLEPDNEATKKSKADVEAEFAKEKEAAERRAQEEAERLAREQEEEAQRLAEREAEQRAEEERQRQEEERVRLEEQRAREEAERLEERRAAEERARLEREEKARREEAERQARLKEERERKEALDAFCQQHGFADISAPRRSGCAVWSAATTYPLHWAAELADARIVGLLLKEGVDTKQKNSSGKTAAQVAQKKDKNGSHQEVKRLLAGTAAPQAGGA